MFIPDYLGDDQWSLQSINTKHYKLKGLLKAEDCSYENILKKHYTPWVELDIGYSWQTWLAEAQRVDELGLFVPHREDYGKGWRSFVLHGSGEGETKKDDGEMFWQESALQNCPSMVQWIKHTFARDLNLKGNFERVRIMALDPGGYIEIHRDNEKEIHDVGPINLAINNPVGCQFIMFYPNSFDKTKLTDEDYIGKVPFAEGRAIQLDVGNYHAVRNNSKETRYHIIIHGNFWPDEKTKSLYDSSMRNTIGNIKTYARV